MSLYVFEIASSRLALGRSSFFVMGIDVRFKEGGGQGFETYIVKKIMKNTGAQSAKKDVISTKPQKGRAS